MDFDKWSFEKKKEFLRGLRHKTADQIYESFRQEGLEMHKGSEGEDFVMITPNGNQYYFAVKPLLAKKTQIQQKMKETYKHRYFLIVKDI